MILTLFRAHIANARFIEYDSSLILRYIKVGWRVVY